MVKFETPISFSIHSSAHIYYYRSTSIIILCSLTLIFTDGIENSKRNIACRSFFITAPSNMSQSRSLVSGYITNSNQNKKRIRKRSNLSVFIVLRTYIKDDD